MNSERARSLTVTDSRFRADPENDSENSASRHPLIAVKRVYSVKDRGSAAAELLLNGFEDYGQHQAQTVLSHARYAGFPTFNGRGGSTESEIDLLSSSALPRSIQKLATTVPILSFERRRESGFVPQFTWMKEEIGQGHCLLHLDRPMLYGGL